jgi:hypothetical protein
MRTRACSWPSFGVMEVGSIGEKPFQKAFAKGLAKILARTFLGSDLATGRDDEGSPARPTLLWEGFPKSAKPPRKAFSMMPVEISPAYQLGRGELPAREDRSPDHHVGRRPGIGDPRRAVRRGITRACSTATVSCASPKGASWRRWLLRQICGRLTATRGRSGGVTADRAGSGQLRSRESGEAPG